MIIFPSILGANGLPFVMQTLTHPAIYLDMWALRLFAEGDRALGIRFREALVSAPGNAAAVPPESRRVQRVWLRAAGSVSSYVDSVYPSRRRYGAPLAEPRARNVREQPGRVVVAHRRRPHPWTPAEA